MGAGFSGEQRRRVDDLVDPIRVVGIKNITGLNDLPESCLAIILMGLEAEDICKLAGVNREFREASSADMVWDSKLPGNYKSLVRKLFDEENPDQLSKKDIYNRLCLPNRFDGDTKQVWMERKSGKICVSMSWKGMKITGIDDRRYWTHIPTDQSRFRTIAYLQQVWWLEVDGSLEFEFPQGSYSLFFRLRLGRPTTAAAATTTAGKKGGRISSGGEVLDRVHGWGNKPVRFKFSTSEGQEAMTQCYLPNEPTGKWICQHVGDFVVEKTNSNSAAPPPTTVIKFSLTQIDCTHTKGGLCLDSLLILPKS